MSRAHAGRVITHGPGTDVFRRPLDPVVIMRWIELAHAETRGDAGTPVRRWEGGGSAWYALKHSERRWENRAGRWESKERKF